MYKRLTLLLSFAGASEAGAQATRMRGCPHVTALTYACADTLRFEFTVPATKLGWALALVHQPGLIGATSATVESQPVPAAGPAPSEAAAQPSPPCGTDCGRCPHYLARCGGCPVTPFFRPGYSFGGAEA